MKVLNSSNFDVYIYTDDHPPQHCHIRFLDGSESIIGLPLLNLIHGVQIDKKVRMYLLENLETLTTKWDKLNPNKYEI
jgi:hypothetical protein